MTEREIEELVAWKDSYVLNSYKDPHQVFADNLGISRHDAKYSATDCTIK